MNTPAWYKHRLHILELQRKRDRSVALAWARLADNPKGAPKGLSGVQEAIARIHDEYDAELMKAWEAYVTEAQAHGASVALGGQGFVTHPQALPIQIRHVWRGGQAWVSARDLYHALGQPFESRDRKAVMRLPEHCRARLEDLGPGREMHAASLVVTVEWAIGLCRARRQDALANWLNGLQAKSEAA